MLELLSPAGSPEAVLAAVQNGADSIYLGLGKYNARRGAKNFSNDEFEKAVRYCRIRGCKVYLTLNTLVNDREIEEAVRCARFASLCGVSGIIIQDIGLVSVLRNAVPDMPLHGSTQMSVHNLAGAEVCAEMGLKRIVLARELSFDQIKFITSNCSIETEIFVHGALCFCHSGQCYMSALIGRRSGNRGMCAQPCRMQYSLGGRMDDYPLSLKDNCLADRLNEIEQAGVACVKIEGRMKRPEYTAIVTKVYHDAIKNKRVPSAEEMKLLEDAFSRGGFTQGYFNGDKKDMFGVRGEASEGTDRLFAEARKGYSEGELRRVPVHFYTVVEKGEKIRAIAFDDEGNKASAFGPVAEIANQKAVSEGFIEDQMYKTGGTPYVCVENKSKVDPGLFVSASAVNNIRRKLISDLSDRRSEVPSYTNGRIPSMPKTKPQSGTPDLIFQVSAPEQMTEELAELKPAYIYAPLEIISSQPELLELFTEKSVVPVAVLPRVITDNSTNDIMDKLKSVRAYGVTECLAGNLGHVFMARAAGMQLRGDFGLNSFNSYSLQVLKNAGFKSATASFELRISQIRDLRKPIDTEMIIYGRLPLMVSDQCIIKASSGHCSCTNPGQLSDRMGSIFPVVREYGCRNVIYNAHKLYLADKKEDILSAGLWGARLLFTTESARECLEVAKGYMGISDYKPNILTRGLYYRGVD